MSNSRAKGLKWIVEVQRAKEYMTLKRPRTGPNNGPSWAR